MFFKNNKRMDELEEEISELKEDLSSLRETVDRFDYSFDCPHCKRETIAKRITNNWWTTTKVFSYSIRAVEIKENLPKYTCLICGKTFEGERKTAYKEAQKEG